MVGRTGATEQEVCPEEPKMRVYKSPLSIEGSEHTHTHTTFDHFQYDRLDREESKFAISNA